MSGFTPIRVALLTSADAPALEPLLGDPNRGALYDIVCAADYSPESREALRVCAAFADATPLAKIIVVRCLDVDTPQEAADEIVRLQQWTPPEIVDRCQYKLLPADHPAEQVVELAKLVHADLIAAGCAGYRSTAEVMRGTTAERIAERSDCPVLVMNEMSVVAANAEAELVTA